MCLTRVAMVRPQKFWFARKSPLFQRTEACSAAHSWSIKSKCTHYAELLFLDCCIDFNAVAGRGGGDLKKEKKKKKWSVQRKAEISSCSPYYGSSSKNNDFHIPHNSASYSLPTLRTSTLFIMQAINSQTLCSPSQLKVTWSRVLECSVTRPGYILLLVIWSSDVRQRDCQISFHDPICKEVWVSWTTHELGDWNSKNNLLLYWTFKDFI